MAGFKEFAHEIRRRETSYPVATGDHLAMYSLKNNRVYIIDDTGCLADFQINDVYAADVQISGQCLIVGQDVITDTVIDGHNLIFRFDVDQIAELSGNMANSNPELADWQMDVYSISGVNNGFNQLRIFDNQTSTTHVSLRKGGRIIFGNNVELANDDGHTVQVYGSAIVTGELTSPAGTIAQQNEKMGVGALSNIVNGSNNIAIGYNSQFNNQSGAANVSIGNGSLTSNQSGLNNIAIGSSTLLVGAAPAKNVAIGSTALANNNASDNVAVGYNSLSVNTGYFNTAVGSESMPSNIGGDYNVAIGKGALNDNVNGSGNVAIGYFAGYFETGSNKLYIANTGGTSADALIYGEFDTDSVWVNGTINITNAINTDVIQCNSLNAVNSVEINYLGQGINLDGTTLDITISPSAPGLSCTIDETGMSVYGAPLTSTYGVNMDVAGLVSESSIESTSFVNTGTTSASTRYLINKNTSGIASYTIDFPSAPSNGQLFTFATRGGITTLTWGGGTANTTPASVSANDRFTWIYNQDDTIWMRVG